jgi:transposase-like protein
VFDDDRLEEAVADPDPNRAIERALDDVVLSGARQEVLSPRRTAECEVQFAVGPTRPQVVLRERFEAFKRRDLYEVHLAALFLDAVFLSVRRDGPKEGVLVAWGFTEEGERVLLGVMLGMRESHEDWLCLGRDLIARGLGAPMLIVADGAPGLIEAVEQCWPSSDRQHCCVHRVRNLLAKLPERERSGRCRCSARLENSQGSVLSNWRAARVRIEFPPLPKSVYPFTMAWTNRSTFQQVIEFTGHGPTE